MNQTSYSWRPNKLVSEGASMYHDAVVDASWYCDNLAYLMNVVNEVAKKDYVIVDFGAGTGISSLFLLKNCIKEFKLFLVDNSPSWLNKAYEILEGRYNVDFFILEKRDNSYSTLAQTIGREKADIVISANTFHLIPNLKDTFKGIYDSLKKRGVFIIQSGNIIREGRPQGLLMIDDTVEKIHNIAVDIIKSDKKYSTYAKNLDNAIRLQYAQRKMIFPDPRSVETYINALKSTGFKYSGYIHKEIKVKYSDWENFLKVKRIQAGILPEIGGKTPTDEEVEIRDSLITQAIYRLFSDMKKNNPMSDMDSFTAEWIYIKAQKIVNF